MYSYKEKIAGSVIQLIKGFEYIFWCIYRNMKISNAHIAPTMVVIPISAASLEVHFYLEIRLN